MQYAAAAPMLQPDHAAAMIVAAHNHIAQLPPEDVKKLNDHHAALWHDLHNHTIHIINEIHTFNEKHDVPNLPAYIAECEKNIQSLRELIASATTPAEQGMLPQYRADLAECERDLATFKTAAPANFHSIAAAATKRLNNKLAGLQSNMMLHSLMKNATQDTAPTDTKNPVGKQLSTKMGGGQYTHPTIKNTGRRVWSPILTIISVYVVVLVCIYNTSCIPYVLVGMLGIVCVFGVAMSRYQSQHPHMHQHPHQH